MIQPIRFGTKGASSADRSLEAQVHHGVAPRQTASDRSAKSFARLRINVRQSSTQRGAGAAANGACGSSELRRSPADGRQVSAAQKDRRTKHRHGIAGQGAQSGLILRDLRERAPSVEPERQLHPHPRPAVRPRTMRIGWKGPRRGGMRSVTDTSLLRFRGGLGHQRVCSPLPPRILQGGGFGRGSNSRGLSSSPVDRPVPRYPRRRLTVSDKSIILKRRTGRLGSFARPLFLTSPGNLHPQGKRRLQSLHLSRSSSC
jgi:hypothetical protein